MTIPGQDQSEGAPDQAERRCVRSGPRALAEPLCRLTTPLFRKRGFADSALVDEWATIVGPRLAAASLPERISFPPRQRREGTLHLRVVHGSLALELQHLQPLLIEKVNAHLGYPAVSQVRFMQGPVPAAAVPSTPELQPTMEATDRQRLTDSIADVADPGLRAALEDLGRAVFSRKRPT